MTYEARYRISQAFRYERWGRDIEEAPIPFRDLFHRARNIAQEMTNETGEDMTRRNDFYHGNYIRGGFVLIYSPGVLPVDWARTRRECVRTYRDQLIQERRTWDRRYWRRISRDARVGVVTQEHVRRTAAFFFTCRQYLAIIAEIRRMPALP